MVVTKSADHIFTKRITTRFTDDLPLGEVLFRVHSSSVNYRDALFASGNRWVTKNYPHAPGVDAAGIVEDSSLESFRPGDEVIATGYDLGMDTPGGFCEHVRVTSDREIATTLVFARKEATIAETGTLD